MQNLIKIQKFALRNITYSFKSIEVLQFVEHNSSMSYLKNSHFSDIKDWIQTVNTIFGLDGYTDH